MITEPHCFRKQTVKKNDSRKELNVIISKGKSVGKEKIPSDSSHQKKKRERLLNILSSPAAAGNGERAPFFSRARFGPGMIGVLSIMIILALTMAFYFRLYYLAIIPALAACGLFFVKYFETIQSGTIEPRKLIGHTCLIVKQISRGQRGVVKVYKSDNALDPELWSAELAESTKGTVVKIEPSQTATVVGMRGGIILLVEPVSQKKEGPVG